MRSRISGDAWDDDEPTISIVMDPDDASEPRLEIGEDDFIRVEGASDDWRMGPAWTAPEPAVIPRPPRVPIVGRVIDARHAPAVANGARRRGTEPPADAPAAAPRRQLPAGRRPKPPEPTLPKFPTNTGENQELLAAALQPEPAPIELVAAKAYSRPAPADVPPAELPFAPSANNPAYVSSAPFGVNDSSAPPAMTLMTTPSAPPVEPPQLFAPSIPPSAYPAYGAPGPLAAVKPSSSLWTVSPWGVIAAVSTAVVAALGTVALMVFLTGGKASKPVRLDPPQPVQSAASATAVPTVSTASAPSQSAPVAPPSASSASLAELAAKGDIDALMQIRARKPDDRTAEESIALARGRTVRKRASLDELAQRLRSDLPLSADRENLGKLREYLDDGETATEALAVLASIGTPMAVDMMFDVGAKAPARSDLRASIDDLLYSKDLRQAASPALAVVLDLRRIETCDEAWRLLPRALDNADRRALPELEQLRIRTGCGPRKNEDCYRCLRGSDDLDKAVRYAQSRAAPEI